MVDPDFDPGLDPGTRGLVVDAVAVDPGGDPAHSVSLFETADTELIFDPWVCEPADPEIVSDPWVCEPTDP